MKKITIITLLFLVGVGLGLSGHLLGPLWPLAAVSVFAYLAIGWYVLLVLHKSGEIMERGSAMNVVAPLTWPLVLVMYAIGIVLGIMIEGIERGMEKLHDLASRMAKH